MKRGFTLIELLVVVLIIGILAAAAFPWYALAVEKSRVSTALPSFKSIREAQHRYNMSTGKDTYDLDFLDVSIPYASRSESSSSTPGFIYNVDNAVKRFKVSRGGIYWSPGRGYIIDFYGRSTPVDGYTAICYPSARNSLGERVCKSFGEATGRMSSANTPVYGFLE